MNSCEGMQEETRSDEDGSYHLRGLQVSHYIIFDTATPPKEDFQLAEGFSWVEAFQLGEDFQMGEDFQLGQI